MWRSLGPSARLPPSRCHSHLGQGQAAAAAAAALAAAGWRSPAPAPRIALRATSTRGMHGRDGRRRHGVECTRPSGLPASWPATAGAAFSTAASAPPSSSPTPAARGGGRWLMLADMHFDQRRLARLLPTCDWFLGEVRRMRPSHVFLLGDTLHTRNEVHVEAASAVAQFLRALLQIKYDDGRPPPHVHVLIGNHDMHHASVRDVTSLDALDVHAAAGERARLHVYRELTLLQLDGQPVLFVPYHHGEDCRKVEEFIQEKVAPQYPLNEVVCLAHLPLSGATISGIALTATTGVRYSHSAVSTALLAQFQRSFLGHFHIHQYVGNSGRVQYVGAPLQFTYGDADDHAKGFISYDPATDAPAILHRNPHAPHFFSKTMEEWQQLVEQREKQLADGEQHTAAATPGAAPASPLSWLAGKCAQILLPVGFDRVTGARPLAQLQRALQEHGRVADIKLKQLELRASATPELAPATPNGDAEGISAADSAMSDTLADPMAATDGVAQSSPPLPRADPLVSALESGELRPLVSAFLELDPNVPAEAKPAYIDVMAGILAAASGGSDGSAATKRGAGVTQDRASFVAQLSTLEVWNFLSVQGPLSFDFSSLSPGVWFICGPNGSGKSLLLEALTWALFGKTLRGHQSEGLGAAAGGVSLDDVLSHSQQHAGSQVRVQVRFTNGYAFTRTHVFGQAGSDLRVETPTGPLKPLSSRRLDQQRVEAILGVDLNRWSSSALLSSNTKNFLSASSEQRRAVVEELLGCGSFAQLQAECKHRRMQAKTTKDIATVSNHQTELQKEAATRAMGDATRAVETLMSHVDAVMERVRQQQQSCAAAAAAMQTAEEALQSAQQRREAQSTSVANLQAELTTLRAGIDVSQLTSLRQRKERADAQLASAVQRQVSALRLEKRQLEASDAAAQQATQQSNHAELRRRATSLRSRIEGLEAMQRLMSQLQVAREALATHASLAAEMQVSPSHLQTLQGVASVLEEATSTDAGEFMDSALRERIEQHALAPVQQVIEQMQSDGSADSQRSSSSRPSSSPSPSDARTKLQQQCSRLEHELDQLAGDCDVEFELSALPDLRLQEQKLLSLSEEKPAEVTSAADRAHTSAAVAAIQAALSQLEDSSTWSSSVYPDIAAAATAVADIRASLQEMEASMQEQQQAASVLQRNCTDEERRLNTMRASEDEAQRAARRANSVHHDEQLRLVRVEEELSALRARLATASEQHTAAQTALAAAIDAHRTSDQSLDAASVSLARYEYWQDRLTDADSKQSRTASRAGSFRAFCLERMLGLLNPLLARNLQLFSQDDSGFVKHSLGCTLTPSLQLEASPGSPSLSNRSEGQRKRSHLALFLALFSLAQSRSGGFVSRFLFLDEAFDALDEDGQRAVHRWISSYANGEDEQHASDPGATTAPASTPAATPSSARHVFVITHSPYAHPALSRGCLHVRLHPVTRASSYVLEAPGDLLAQHRFVSVQSGVTQADMEAMANTVVTKKPKATRKPRKPKGKQVEETPAAAAEPVPAPALAETSITLES